MKICQTLRKSEKIEPNIENECLKNLQIVLKNKLFCSWPKIVRHDEEKRLLSPTSVSINDIFIKIVKLVNSGMDNVAE